jgi:hypothetical protein
MDEKALFERLDRIIMLLEIAVKQPSLLKRILNGAATGVGIMSLISIIDVVKSWLGG